MTLPWYPFFWGDYSSKTMHLSQGQHGAFTLFLRWIYTTGTPIPHKQRFSIAKATLDLERSDATAVLEQFFTKRGTNWHNAKAEDVIKTAGEKHQKYVEAGRLGGQKKSSDARATLEPRSSNHNHNQTEESKKVISGNFGGKNGAPSKPLSDEFKLSQFQKTLAESFPDLQRGWKLVGEANDPAHPNYPIALKECKLQARGLGKGWPHQWPK